MSHEIAQVKIKHVQYAPHYTLQEIPLPKEWTSYNQAVEHVHLSLAKMQEWCVVLHPSAVIEWFPCGCIEICIKPARKSTPHAVHFMCDAHFGLKRSKVFKEAWLPYMGVRWTPELRLLPKMRMFM